MAQKHVCVLAVAAVLLLLFATDCRSMGLRSQEHQRFSKEERRDERDTEREYIFKGQLQIRIFPTVLSTSFIQHEVMGEYSHLFTVQGSDPSLQPCLLLAHFDVVPAPAEGWEVPLFSGLERDGFIDSWGTLDDKNSVMAFLQALELLSFFISLALGSMSASSGVGAQKISALLQSRGVQLAFIVDEGSFIFDGFIPDLKNPFAMIANSEKGHSSAPPKERSMGILAAAVSQLEQTPLPNMLGSWSLMATLGQLAHELPFPANIILSNLWLSKPLVSRNYVTNAMVRTTTALTMFNAGVKGFMVLSPGECHPPPPQTTINFRIHSAQTVQGVLELTKKIVADERVQFHVLSAFDPLPISPYDDKALGYQLLLQTTQSVFPEVNTITPGVCISNTDSRHFTNLTTGIYKFSAIHLQPEAFRSIYGINEKISVQAYENQVKFFFELIQNADTDKEPVSHQHKL
uniref:Peptidase M20 domain containing 1 n=1 Tax=Cebus imitator TaxID=2715852 RepID=A0A2K5SE21_CEBIM